MLKVLCCVLLCSGFLEAAVILVDRALPMSTHVNNISAPGRSNISWGNIDGFINGDSFTTGDWIIESLSVWIVGSAYDFSGMSLYGGVRGTYGHMPPLLSTEFSVSTDYYLQEKVLDPCNAVGIGVSYQDGGLGCLPITRVTFVLEPFRVVAGAVFDFAIDAVPSSPSSCSIVSGDVSGCLFIHASHEALAGNVQSGSDGRYRQFDTFGVLEPVSINSSGNGWDKDSDINVLVLGTVSGATSGFVGTPEPLTVETFIVGVSALVCLGYRRRRLRTPERGWQ